ncbi:hypothetical protein C5Y96_14885 [Blastopirellula marina]|uniref:Uncharacterized protein n=1 Tax=Blastopirellula marina TaxID=124 RepID=A0A2S8FF24_9BACT|nr:hypothetical protein C5Y96_14885 [Blastopirellula marina]RCS50879.1 hypothetical protein DTL36_14895 [Bremerella cremea]
MAFLLCVSGLPTYNQTHGRLHAAIAFRSQQLYKRILYRIALVGFGLAGQNGVQVFPWASSLEI